ncbi:MAG: DUF4355 domain-containing protein [Synergistes sp.]|nr:DUF4355 domain-containing protein [Synergistes sp.]
MADNGTNTTPQGGTTDPAAQNTGTGERTFSQADVDRMIADRLSREQKKYADYEDLKKAKEELDSLKEGQKSELEKANAAREKAEAKVKEFEAKVKLMELNALKAKLAAEAGIPAELSDRIRGEDETSVKADIEGLKKLFPPKAAGGSGAPQAGNAPNKDLKTLYGEAIKAGRIEEAMIYKKQMYEQ